MVSTLYMYVHFLLNFNFWSLMEGSGLLVSGTDDPVTSFCQQNYSDTQLLHSG